MTNAEQFKKTFGIYAEEFWSYTEKQMLDWINTDVPDINVGDTISRQAAIDVLDIGCELLRRVLDDTDVVGVERAKYEWGLGLIESYISDMRDLPSAQPVRKTGQWIKRKKGAIGYNCSCCGKSDISNHFDYCPNCGADMRGEQDG